MTTQEIENEIEYLEEKRVKDGWTQKDADRYNYLMSLLK
jgi:hypothetical protein